MKVRREGEPAKAKRAGEDERAEGGAAKRVRGAVEEPQPDPPAITVPAAEDDVPDPATYTVITEVEFSAAPKSRQFCVLTLNLLEHSPELIKFLVMLEEKVGRVHLTFDRDERTYHEQFRDHVKEVFAANDLPPFDFEAYVAWPEVKLSIECVLEFITDNLDEHSFSKSLKMPTPEPNPQPWPFFHDCAVKSNEHWAIVVCSKD
jgi:hypothetical protein